MNFVKTENKDKQISLCYQMITGWLNVHTPSGRNVRIHVSYIIKQTLFTYVEKFCLCDVLCVACIAEDLKKYSGGGLCALFNLLCQLFQLQRCLSDSW